MATKKAIEGKEFISWRENTAHKYSDAGDPVKLVYSGKYDKDGVLILEEVGKENLYDYIQSFAESVDINNIIQRFMLGDTEALRRVQGFYFDTTQVPDTMADLLNKLNKAETEFNKMPTDFKAQYGNDFAQFICQFDPRILVEMANKEKMMFEKAVAGTEEMAKDE